VREVVMLGRRGPAQAAFTNAEIKELGELDGVDVIVDPADLELDPMSAEHVKEDKSAARNVEILRSFAARTEHHAPRRIRMRFLTSPVELIGENGRVVQVKVERNELVVDKNGGLRAKGIGVYDTIEAGLVLRSVGYRGVPLPGVPFQEGSFIIPNVNGRVIRPRDDAVILGEYVVGWAKRGPSGVIGTNKPDAVATVAAMVEDLPKLPGIPDENRDPQRIVELLRVRKPDFVTYADWKRLDAYETARGAEQGRPRVKVTTVPEMLEVIRGTSS